MAEIAPINHNEWTVIGSLTTRHQHAGNRPPAVFTFAPMPFQLDLVPLAGFAGLMAIAAFEDFRRLVIPNPVVAALGVVWLLHLAASPHLTLAGVVGAAGCAAMVFVAGALLFSRGLIGGGDVKLLAAASLWAGPGMTPALLIVTAVLGGLLTLALLCATTLWAVLAPGMAAAAARPVPVPYGAAIAAAALIVTLPPNFS
jgi:prepilin peptidase CpaA